MRLRCDPGASAGGKHPDGMTDKYLIGKDTPAPWADQTAWFASH